MIKITTILWDVDDTLLDFHKAESVAIKRCFDMYNLGVCSDEMVEIYSQINKKYWKKLEKGEITKRQVLVGRFEEFFALENIDIKLAEKFDASYQKMLGENPVPKDNSYELLKKLKSENYKQYAITNGTKIAQDTKLKQSGLIYILDKVFISEIVGAEKPNVEFFDYVFDNIDSKKEECIVVGDSLTSDMCGANNYDLMCCFYNPYNTENKENVRVNYEIKNLWELEKILKGE